VVASAWPAVVAGQEAVLRQASLGLPLAAAAAALLAPGRRPWLVDGALALIGAALLVALACATQAAIFTALAAVLFLVSVAVRRRARREGARSRPE
jgi:hypothetical protein